MTEYYRQMQAFFDITEEDILIAEDYGISPFNDREIISEYEINMLKQIDATTQKFGIGFCVLHRGVEFDQNVSIIIPFLSRDEDLLISLQVLESTGSCMCLLVDESDPTRNYFRELEFAGDNIFAVNEEPSLAERYLTLLYLGYHYRLLLMFAKEKMTNEYLYDKLDVCVMRAIDSGLFGVDEKDMTIIVP